MLDQTGRVKLPWRHFRPPLAGLGEPAATAVLFFKALERLLLIQSESRRREGANLSAQTSNRVAHLAPELI